MEVAVAVAVA